MNHNGAVRIQGAMKLRTIVGLIVLAGVLYVLYEVQHNRIGTFTIGSESMLPTLQVGETWLMGPLPARLKVGDVIVFREPGADHVMLAKRIVAIESDSVELKRGQLYVNGQASPPPQGEAPPLEGVPDKSWVVGKDEFFLAGDNRPVSKDSRDYGPVKRERFVGLLRNKVAN